MCRPLRKPTVTRALGHPWSGRRVQRRPAGAAADAERAPQREPMRVVPRSARTATSSLTGCSLFLFPERNGWRRARGKAATGRPRRGAARRAHVEELQGVAVRAQGRAGAGDHAGATGGLAAGLSGQKGRVDLALRSIGGLLAEQRPLAGKLANEVRAALEQAFEARRLALADEALARDLTESRLDVHCPGGRRRWLSAHLDADAAAHLCHLWPDGLSGAAFAGGGERRGHSSFSTSRRTTRRATCGARSTPTGRGCCCARTLRRGRFPPCASTTPARSA